MKYNWENLTTIQYQRMLQNGESKKPEDLLWALTNKDRNELTLHEINTLSIGSLEPKTDPIVAQIFIGSDGVLYGLQDINEITFGLFDDLMSLGTDVPKFLNLITSYMYRPVTNMSWISKAKLKVISKLRGKSRPLFINKWIMRTMNSLNYTIEPYDPLKCEDRIEVMDNTPAYVGHHIVTFFLILSKELQKNSLTSLQSQLKEMKKTLQKHI